MYTDHRNSRRKFLNRVVSVAGSLLVLPPFVKAGVTGDPGESFTLLFQGDSITDGNRGRTEDPNHIMGHGYAFSIASRVGADHPGRNLKFINKGISGNTVSDLSARWQQDALELKPDLISILVGVNDVLFRLRDRNTLQPSTFEEEYKKMLTRTREALPDVLLVLGEPFVLPVGMVKENEAQWTPEVRQCQHVVKKLAHEFNAVFVGYQQVFSDACKKAPAAYWIWDGIHPTVAGHELMAREWMRVVGKRLPWITRR
jgi:lysophospholipase L1-like esterase